MIRCLASLLCVLAFAPAFSLQALADEYTGQASVIDGDTLEIHGQRIRLSGIDAPESSQLCRGDDSLQYRFGAKAANELDDHIAGRPVSCEGVVKDQYGRVVAVCSIDGEDIALWLVRAGLAFDWPGIHAASTLALRKKLRERALAFGQGVTLCLGPIGRAFVTAGDLWHVRMTRAWGGE
jgi:endonuclease YncB( thermonuclease family)